MAGLMMWCACCAALQASTVAVPLLEEAHGDFELQPFKECANQAIVAVLELYAAADWAALRWVPPPSWTSGSFSALHGAECLMALG